MSAPEPPPRLTPLAARFCRQVANREPDAVKGLIRSSVFDRLVRQHLVTWRGDGNVLTDLGERALAVYDRTHPTPKRGTS